MDRQKLEKANKLIKEIDELELRKKVENLKIKYNGTKSEVKNK